MRHQITFQHQHTVPITCGREGGGRGEGRRERGGEEGEETEKGEGMREKGGGRGDEKIHY